MIHFKILSQLQSHYDQMVGTNYSDPAPVSDPSTDNPFIDNGQPLNERFQSGSEELMNKWDYLIKI